MTADTNSPLLGLLLMGTGNDNNAWGDNHNNNVTLLIEQAIAGRTDITGMTGGAVTLTRDQMRSRVVTIQGTLTADLVLTLPDTTRLTRFINICSGNFAVLVNSSGAGSQPVNLPYNKWVDIQIFLGFVGRSDAHEVGRLVYHAGTTAPGGAFECNGAALKRASYPDLFAVIGTTYGNNDATDFKLPDAYTAGRYLRSRTASVTIGTTQANQNKSHTHTGSGTTSGASASHTHTGSGSTSGASVDHTHTGSGTTSVQSADHTHTGSGTTSGMSANHTHIGTSDGPSVSLSHSHTVSGTTGTESATHTHSYNGSVTTTSAVAAAGHNFADTSAQTTGAESATHTHTWSGTSSTVDLSHTHTFATSIQSNDHTHTYSFTTSGISANHTHNYSFTTSGVSVDHAHGYSFTTATNSVDHTHTYSFTTSTGSADGTEARPETLVAMLCIRY